MNQLNAVGSVGGMAMAMLGGAWVPVATMPGWAQAVAPALPTYWAMQGLRGVILKGRGVPDVVVPVLVMAGFGLLYTVIAAAKFRFEDPKLYSADTANSSQLPAANPAAPRVPHRGR
jgi:ABC-2 type transport system permease protein